MTQTLADMRAAHEAALASFEKLLSDRFPGARKYHWYRALSAIKGENVRRNDDQSRDVALAADADLKAAHDEYIRLLHLYYRARDGERGFLG